MMEKYLEYTKKLMQEFEDSNIEYFETAFGDYSLVLKKGMDNSCKSFQEKVISLDNQPSEKFDEIIKEDIEIKSPIVGVFYSSKSPADKPFVGIGDKVKKGDVVCIIESMKMMNEIKANSDGIIKKICCHNEDLVEFDQVMFVLEKIDD